jgi:glycosyltransferase involved in cell wall biosynthesis
MRKSISLIIPVYNEELQIGITVDAVIENIRRTNCNYRIYLVDDGSSDNTWPVIKKLSQTVDNITAIKLSRNFGKEAAICAGLENVKGDCVILMDADMQHPPALIPEMVRLWKDEGYEVVEAVKSSRGKESRLNRFGAALFYSMLKKLGGVNIKNASDFKLMDIKAVEAWRSLKERNTFFRGMSAWVGFNRTTVPFEVPERDIGKSRWSMIRLIKLAVNAITSYSAIPLQIVTVLGTILLITSVIMGVQTLVKKFTGQALTGFTTVILLQLIIGSSLMISLGIIGTYIARIFDEVKSRPRYIISELCESKTKHKEKVQDAPADDDELIVQAIIADQSNKPGTN